MPPSEQATWFSEHVLPNEPALRAYLHRRFPTLPDHDDLVQETYARILRENAAGRSMHERAFSLSPFLPLGSRSISAATAADGTALSAGATAGRVLNTATGE